MIFISESNLLAVIFVGKLVGFCMLCELHQHIKSCFKQSGRIEPRSIVDKLQGKNLMSSHIF